MRVDQHVSPTLNTNLAEMLLEIADRRIKGILHTAGANRVSRYDFAVKCAETFNLSTDLITPAKIGEMAWKAKRPIDSSLNVNKVETMLNAKPLKINDALKIMKNNLTQHLPLYHAASAKIAVDMAYRKNIMFCNLIFLTNYGNFS